MAPPPAQPAIQRTLRKVAIGAALCGIFLNIVSVAHAAGAHYRRKQHSMVDVTAAAFLPLVLSLIWNTLNIVDLPFWKSGAPKIAVVITDTGFFLGFLAVAIANGVVMDDFGGWNYTRGGRVMLYTYNSVPWLVCAAIHLSLVGMVVVKTLKIGRIRIGREATCPDCRRKWRKGDPRARDDGAEESLLAEHEYDEDADGA